MAKTSFVNVKGLGKPSEYFSSFANFPLKEDLPMGTLVALDHATQSLEKADQTKRPVGVVFFDTVTAENLYKMTGDMDLTSVCKKGERVELFKHFLLSNVVIKEEWDNVRIGDEIYLEGTAHTIKLTKTKPATGWKVGTVERIGDRLIRFDLANVIKIG